MKVMRLSSGLGNAMFQYAAYLQLCKLYPNDDIYIDSIWYEFTGYPYEIDKIFNLHLDEIDFFKKTKKDGYIPFDEIFDKMYFWKQKGYDTLQQAARDKLFTAGLNFAELPQIYNQYGRNFKIVSNLKFSFEDWMELSDNSCIDNWNTTKLRSKIKGILKNKNSMYYQVIKAVSNKYPRRKLINDILHLKRPDFSGDAGIGRLVQEGDVYYNIYGTFHDCDNIRSQLLKAYTFPPLIAKDNMNIAEEIKKTVSVAVHARVLDFSYGMKDVCERNYYKKAIRYIKSKVHERLVFFIFSDNIDWCKENYEILGLDENDPVYYVEGNRGEESFRDMQLMSYCKHNVIPNSTFSWWGGYLNQNKEKIFITPYGTLPGTISF